jgi:hypothetical protein
MKDELAKGLTPRFDRPTVMKPFSIVVGLLIWLISVLLAFQWGTRLTQATDSSPETIAESNDAEPEAATPEGETASEEAYPLEVVTSFLETSALNLDAALDSTTSLTEAETRALLAEAFALPENDYRRARMLRHLLEQLARTAPRDALSMASQISSLGESERARIGVLEVWGESDPVAALAWAQLALVNEPLRTQNRQILAIYEGYAKTNPQAAFTAALAMPAASSAEQRLQSAALQEIIDTQIENGGLLQAKLQVELLEDSPTKTALLNELVDEWASFDPEGAAAYVQSLGEGASESMKTALLGEWAESDPAAAAAWLGLQQVGDETLSRASTAIIREWTRHDLAASAEWLNSQPDSPTLDRAIMSYTYRAAQEDPASAMTWAESIDNEWMRNRMMQHVSGSWKADDPDAFQNYLDNADLDDEQKEHLQNAEAIHSGGRRWR